MPNKLQQTLVSMKNKDQKAFIPYTMLGDRNFHESMSIIDLYVESGATAIEIGIPFSDPIADGPTIQKAGLRALENNYSMKEMLDFIKLLANKYSTPIIIMTYLNPIINYGIPKFLSALNDANVNGLIIPDLPIEEWDLLTPHLLNDNLALIPLITLTTHKNRINKINTSKVPFIYMVTFNGITGNKEASVVDILDKVKEVNNTTKVPIIAGFGISNTKQIQLLNTVVDGVIVASELIRLKESNNYSAIRNLIEDNTSNSID